MIGYFFKDGKIFPTKTNILTVSLVKLWLLFLRNETERHRLNFAVEEGPLAQFHPHNFYKMCTFEKTFSKIQIGVWSEIANWGKSNLKQIRQTKICFKANLVGSELSSTNWNMFSSDHQGQGRCQKKHIKNLFQRAWSGCTIYVISFFMNPFTWLVGSG